MSDADRDPVDGWLRSALAPRDEALGDDVVEPPPIDDGLLGALRRGELPTADVEALEERLANERETRLLAAAHVQAAAAPTPLWASIALPRRRRFAAWQVVLAAMVLLGVGVGLWQTRRPLTVPAYVLTAVEGQVRTVRADPDGQETGPPVFTPESRILLSFAPPSDVAEAPPVALFVADQKGTLTRVPARIEQSEGGGLTFEIAAESALGRRFGDHRLLVAIGPSGGAEGRTPSDAQGLYPSTRWIAVDIRYVAASDGGSGP